MSEELYQQYVERICIAIEDGLGTPEHAMRMAREQLTADTRKLGMSPSDRFALANKFKRRVREEGILDNN